MPKSPQGKTLIGERFIATERLLDLLVADLVIWEAGKRILEKIVAKFKAHIWDRAGRFNIFAVRIVGLEKQEVRGIYDLTDREISFLCRILLELNLLASTWPAHGNVPTPRGYASEFEVAKSRLLKDDGWDETAAAIALTYCLDVLAKQPKRISRDNEEDDDDEEEGERPSGSPRLLPEEKKVSCLTNYWRYTASMNRAGYAFVAEVIADTETQFTQKILNVRGNQAMVPVIKDKLNAMGLAFKEPGPNDEIILPVVRVSKKPARTRPVMIEKKEPALQYPGTSQKVVQRVFLPVSLSLSDSFPPGMAQIDLASYLHLSKVLVDKLHELQIRTLGQLVNLAEYIASQITSEEKEVIREALDDKGLVRFFKVAV